MKTKTTSKGHQRSQSSKKGGSAAGCGFLGRILKLLHSNNKVGGMGDNVAELVGQPALVQLVNKVSHTTISRLQFLS